MRASFSFACTDTEIKKTQYEKMFQSSKGANFEAKQDPTLWNKFHHSKIEPLYTSYHWQIFIVTSQVIFGKRFIVSIILYLAIFDLVKRSITCRFLQCLPSYGHFKKSILYGCQKMIWFSVIYAWKKGLHRSNMEALKNW